MRESQNRDNLRTLQAVRGDRDHGYDSGDDEVRVVKKRKEIKTIAVVELDSD